MRSSSGYHLIRGNVDIFRRKEAITGNFESYFYMALRYKALRYAWRSHHLEIPIEELPDSSHRALRLPEQPEKEAMAKEILEKALNILSQRDRHILAMSVESEMSPREIAEALGTSSANVAKMLYKIKRKLQDFYAKEIL